MYNKKYIRRVISKNGKIIVKYFGNITSHTASTKHYVDLLYVYFFVIQVNVNKEERPRQNRKSDENVFTTIYSKLNCIIYTYLRQ